MLSRRLTLLAIAVAALAAPPAHAAAVPTVRVVTCSGDQGENGGSVTYEARMHAVPGTERMALRIRLLEKFGDGRFHRVAADGLEVWRPSRPRARAYVHDQHVKGLRPGGVYRAAVQFRWYGADGSAIRSARVRSAPCKQPGGLPNLRVAGIDSKPGDVDGTAVYRVQIVNGGGSAARHVGVLLRVDGEVVDEGEVIAALDPGKSRTITFNGPVCRRQLRVIVDPRELIPESRERDNVRAPTCL